MPSSASELKNTVLRAGAGAGKTTTLVSVFLDFVKQYVEKNNKLPRIVVTTFTRKATQELKERLLKKALQEEREDLFHFVSSKSNVQISTIHGVLNLYLSRYGAAIGLTPDYKILSEVEIRKSARKIIRKIILDRPHLQELLEEYDFGTLEGYLLGYFTEAQVYPDLQFADEDYFRERTKDYVADLRSRAQRIGREILSQTDKEAWVLYIQSLLAVDWSQLDSVRSFYDHAKKPSYLKKNPPFSEILNEELESFRESLDVYIEKPSFNPEFWQKHQRNAETFSELAKDFSQEFEKQKLEMGLLSMSDLETVAIKLIQEFPETAQSFSQEWDFWMIDEYQDTSPLQVKLMKALVGNRPSFIVGDPQQSIYLFRGARSEVFFEKMDEVLANGGDLQEKMVNYRSNPEVLQFINHYFVNLDSQFSAMEVDPQKVADPDSQNLQVIITQEAEGGEAYQEELASVARIQELIGQGVSPEKICLLSRTHKVLEETARLAHSYGVPVQLHSSGGFFERREVQDALNFLKFLLNPHDNYVFVALLRSPWLYLPDDQIISYCSERKNSYWREAQIQAKSEGPDHPIHVLKRYLGLAESLGLAWTLKRALAELGYLDYSQKLDASGRREANLWKIVSLLSQEERRPGFNFLDFIDAGIATLSTDQGGDDSDANPVIEPQRVNFMTVHASKGLQFDHVILPALGKNPDARKDADFYYDEETNLWTLPVRDDENQKMVQSLLAEKIHEKMLEREQKEFNRVLYVALTRAKKGISLLIGAKPGKKSWAAGCHLDLEEGLHEEEGFQYIVRRENLYPIKSALKEMPASQVRSPWQNLEERASGLGWNISVTDLISSHVVAAESGKNENLLPALKRAQQGTEAHKLFESLKYTDVATVREQASEAMAEALDYVVQLKEVPALRIIQNGFVEWGFACQLNENLLQGQIDLWGIDGGIAWILDYKTGSQKYAETAFAQMEVYAWALAKMKQLEEIQEVKLVVIYPMDQKVKIRDLKVADLDEKIQKYFSGYRSLSVNTPG